MIDKLAKLLATENIVVEHRNAPTASFDTKNRILTLPMWKDVTPTLETLLVGHEVGHALYTPDSGWSGLITEKKTICNIVEDARIERKMKIKYPGLRRDFYEGYKELFDKDFFKIKEKNIETMNFLDRLNLHFKIGSFQNIMFQEDEKCFVDDIEAAKTWDEVVDITHRIFEFLKKKEEEGDTRGGDHFIQIDDEDEDEDDQSEYMESDDIFDESVEGEDQFTCDTQTSMDDSIAEQLIDEKSKPIYYVNVQDKEYKNITLPFSSLLQMFRDEKDAYIRSESMYRFKASNNDDFCKELNSKITKQNKISWNKFLNVNSKVVSYLVKEFEMKKAADHYIRQRESKTGVINCNKLHAYKIIDDIFKKTTILPESKNHGLVLFVDFSGSMTENMLGTIEQLLCLTLFCRRINIPHRVYAFTDQTISEKYMKNPDPDHPLNDKIGDISVKNADRLIELFTEKMRNNQFSEMGQWLLNFADGCNQKNWKFRKAGNDSWYSNCIHLNGTPLNSALIYARKLIVDFKKQTNAQIVNCVVLTDGESTVSQYRIQDGWNNFIYHYKYKLVARDIQTKEEFVLQKKLTHDYETNTGVFVQFLKNRCSVNVICYRIENSNSRIKKTINAAYPNQSEIVDINYRKMRKQKYFHMKGYLKFDDYFLIQGGEEIQTEDSLLGDEVYETKNSLAKAFIKVNIRRGVSRVLLSKFIEKIAA